LFLTFFGGCSKAAQRKSDTDHFLPKNFVIILSKAPPFAHNTARLYAVSTTVE
jgi:hypothetical protein